MSYTDTLDQFGDQVGQQVGTAYASYQEGTITEEEFVAIVLAYLAAADAIATGMADAALAGFLSAAQGYPVPPLGTPPPSFDHEPRVRELLAEGADVDQWTSYGRGSALASAQDAYGDAMVEREIPGWTRVLEPGACPLCRDLAGVVLPAKAPMYHHAGCGCTQRPVLTESQK